MDWSRLLSALKPTGWHFLALALASGFLVFAPPSILSEIGLGNLRRLYGLWLGLSFVGFSALTLGSAISWVVGERTARQGTLTAEQRQEQERERSKASLRLTLESRLRNLGDDEWRVVNKFIERNVTILPFELNDGAVLSLLAKKVLFRPEQIFAVGDPVSYGLNSWVKEFLKEHPELQRRT